MMINNQDTPQGPEESIEDFELRRFGRALQVRKEAAALPDTKRLTPLNLYDLDTGRDDEN